MKNQKPISKKKKSPNLNEKNQRSAPVKDTTKDKKKEDVKNTPYAEDDVDMHDETSNKIRNRDEFRNKNTEEDGDENSRNERESEDDEETPEISDEHSDDGPHE